MHHLDLSTLTLASGGHRTRAEGVCFLEAVAWWADEPHSDRPDCVSPILGGFGRSLNDVLPADLRQRLRPYVPQMVGTRGDGLDERRGYLALDWLLRVYTPAWLRLVPALVSDADALAGFRPVADLETAAEIGVMVRAAATRSAAAWAAAWDAAGDAAWAAARDAAGDAARDAARDAAWDAAWDAARVGTHCHVVAGIRRRPSRRAREAVTSDLPAPDVTTDGQLPLVAQVEDMLATLARDMVLTGDAENEADALAALRSALTGDAVPLRVTLPPTPDVELRIFGQPAPQGSKNAFRNQHTGRIQQVESSKRVGPWRQDVSAAAQRFVEAWQQANGTVAGGQLREAVWEPLDGPLVASMVFTLPKPKSAPKTRRTWPQGRPDAVKAARSTEDALTTAGIWVDDARVVEYVRLAKVFPGEDDDALRSPGALVRIWTMATWLGEA